MCDGVGRAVPDPRIGALAGARRRRVPVALCESTFVRRHRRRPGATAPPGESGLRDLHVRFDGQAQGGRGHPQRSGQLRGRATHPIRCDADLPDSALLHAEFRRVRLRVPARVRRRGDHGDRPADNLRRGGTVPVPAVGDGHARIRHHRGARHHRAGRTLRLTGCGVRRRGVSAGTGAAVGARPPAVQCVRADRGHRHVEHQRTAVPGRRRHAGRPAPRFPRGRPRRTADAGARRRGRGVVHRRRRPRPRIPGQVGAHGGTVRGRPVQRPRREDVPHRGRRAVATRPHTGVSGPQ
ncbi:putative non-ribosomal peptide synthetase [Rhodococcus wratislaviensis]|uniref:Putative non-ribosomal peptide synthetase n=1 Tax=Rhodococcus wratislaviensis TaxID=44752 RepID=A0A402CI58_RHOWR|nr:putative non-ribosomal peptide synthetase [Rhodococcus wratislaviensis]